MLAFKSFLKDKKVLVLGLGNDFEVLEDIDFLLKNNVKVVLSDMRNERRLPYEFKKIKAQDNFSYILGNMENSLLDGVDIVLKSSSVSLDCGVIREAFVRNIPVETIYTLFLKLSPPVTFIGVIGFYAKSDVSNLISNFIKETDKAQFLFKPEDKRTLQQLKKIKKEDIVIIILSKDDIFLCSRSKLSPQILVSTTFIYYPDLFNHLTYTNYIIAHDEVIDSLKNYPELKIKAKMLRTGISIIPASWNLIDRKRFFLDNVALALRVAEVLKIPFNTLQKRVENFKQSKGSIEFIKKVDGIEYYNDGCSTHGHSVRLALSTVSNLRDTVLIAGGGIIDDYNFEDILQFVMAIVFIPGSGMAKFYPQLLQNEGVIFKYAHSIEEAVDLAHFEARKGGKVIFSPGTEPFGKVEDRCQKFISAVKKL